MHIVLIYRGLGWLVAVLVFGVSLLANFLFDAVYGDGYYDRHKWPLALSLTVSGGACWFVGQYLKRRSDIVAIEKVTGKEIRVNKSDNTFFLIPVHVWGPILGVIALAILVSNVVKR